MFLGMRIRRNRDKGEILIDQEEYAIKVLERFGMSRCNPRDTPMDSRRTQSKRSKTITEKTDLGETVKQISFPFREFIGSLLYLAGGTRPDISFPINVLSRRQSCPTVEDWEDALKVLKYIKGTSHYALKYTGEGVGLMAKTDTSFSDWIDSTSTSGYLMLLFGDPIAWRSHKQREVTQSTCKAEYLALSEACRELVSMEKGLREVSGDTYYPFILWCDNAAACKNVEMEGCHKICDFDDDVATVKENLRFRELNGVRREMTEVHGDYVKQLRRWKKVRVEWVPSAANPADLFTKPLERTKHRRFTREIFKQ